MATVISYRSTPARNEHTHKAVVYIKSIFYSYLPCLSYACLMPSLPASKTWLLLIRRTRMYPLTVVPFPDLEKTQLEKSILRHTECFVFQCDCPEKHIQGDRMVAVGHEQRHAQRHPIDAGPFPSILVTFARIYLY